MMCPFTCDISHDSCLLKYCGWWNFVLCANTESSGMHLYSQLEQAPEAGAEGVGFVLEAHFFYRNWEYCSSNIRLWFCHQSLEKQPVLCSSAMSSLPAERLSTLLHWARTRQWHSHHLLMQNIPWKLNSLDPGGWPRLGIDTLGVTVHHGDGSQGTFVEDARQKHVCGRACGHFHPVSPGHCNSRAGTACRSEALENIAENLVYSSLFLILCIILYTQG